MKKTVLVAAAALALSVMTAPVALAQDDSQSCAEAQLTFQRAHAAFDEADAADKAAADAKAADAALGRAVRERKDAEAEARKVLTSSAPNAATLANIRNNLLPAARDALQDAQDAAEPNQEEINRLTQEIANLEEKERLVAAAVDAQAREAEARAEAAKTDADRLQDVADQTNAEALSEARDAARELADRICGGVTTPPTPAPAPEEDLDCADFPLSSGRTAQDVLNETPTDDPHGLDADGDRIACEPGQDTAADGSDLGDTDEPVVVTPQGGISTGVGPA